MDLVGPPKPPPGRAETTPDQPPPGRAETTPDQPAAHREPPPPRTITLRVPRLRVAGPGSARRVLAKRRTRTARMPYTPAGTEQPAAGPDPGSARDQDRAEARSEAVSRGLAGLTVLPALAVAAWLLPGLPLLAAGVFAPVPMLLIGAPLLAALAVNVLHRVPARWPAC